MTDTPNIPDGRPRRILYVVEDMWGCAWYRCHVPGVELMRRGHEVVLREGVEPQLVQQADIVVFQRPSVPGAVTALEWARDNGVLGLVDLDDDLWNIHQTNPARTYWQGTGRLEILESCLRAAAGVTVSTRSLAALIRPMNRNVTVLPNMLPDEHWPAKLGPRVPKDRLVVGWAGSQSHVADLEILKGTVETLVDAYPNVEFLFAGMTRLPFRESERIRTAPHVMIEEYPNVLAQFDIGMIPLVEGRFNRCKSDLKFLEYAMLGIPTVASHVEPYAESVEHGVNGLLAKNAKDWLKSLRRLIEDRELRDRMSAAARAFAETRTISGNIDKWERVYGIR